MEKKAKEFRERIKLDDHFFKECQKEIEVYHRNLDTKLELARKMEEEGQTKQAREEEQWKILSEFGPIL